MSLTDDIRAYRPCNEQEEGDRRLVLRQLEDDSHVFDRSSPAHMTCSLWTVDPAKSSTLMVYHRIYDSWSWIGGHADGERDLARVALRELAEETGTQNARLVDAGPGGIYSLEALAVAGHLRHGAYVSSHLHLNLTYLALASPDDPLRPKLDENSAVRWVRLDEVCGLSKEAWMCERVYRKLIGKLDAIDLRACAGAATPALARRTPPCPA